MENTLSLNTILSQANCEFLVFDLSRRVTLIDTNDFVAIEENRIPYPYPTQRHAQMGIAFWQPDQAPWIWFLKMPLDERGLLNQAALGDFIQYVAQAMGATLDKTPTEEEQEKLAANPYTFTPQDDKKAMFHAFLTDKLRQPASQYYDHAQHYMSGELGWDAWQGVGLQGIADLCARMDKHNNLTRLRKALSHMPPPPKYAVLGCLEHCAIADSLAIRIEEEIHAMLSAEETDLFLLTAHVRALAGAKPEIVQRVVEHLLSLDALRHREMLIAIAGRCWQALTKDTLLDTFLIAVAEQNNQAFFQQMVADLVMIPKLRPQVLALLHGSASPALLDAVKQLQQSVKA
ncbi:DUF3549 domain-containing protein [Grimontia hollisae]|uniref:DUF3549 domain-containing protein n=1 Tax=Grimontia hollisae CIP 101886 TaxID=675812 RepID=D0ICN9_GRIHO|nr:DUF3549 family protein [Grimontia hollisae]AUW37798.1 DUF3549 domain-containing protein [Grimontia hollisae]EEY71657.1 hypothetical protein VHA_003518 [Grimontia hollisae CIP 101886]STO42841.1 Protein of uncharacterised function (DUF3549) [Grimontia hollisae]